MTMSTQTLTEAARLMGLAVLLDSIQIYNVGEPVTAGFDVTRSLTSAGDAIPGLVQTTTLQNAVESSVESTYSVKVIGGTVIKAGQAVKVIACLMEPDLVGKMLLLDKVSQNGAAVIRKCVASDFQKVNQEGKEGL